MLYVGIDPGKNGGLVGISSCGDIELTRMPETTEDIWEWFALCPNETVAAIEWINPGYKGSNKSSMSKLYGSYREIRMCLVAASIPFQELKPGWATKYLGIEPRRKKDHPEGEENTTQWKRRLGAEGRRLYPNLDCWNWNLGDQDAVADALLIAEIAGRLHAQK